MDGDASSLHRRCSIWLVVVELGGLTDIEEALATPSVHPDRSTYARMQCNPVSTRKTHKDYERLTHLDPPSR